ncbi:MAG: fibronectin type III domain-containing protein [Sumerlaeia bacterium]
MSPTHQSALATAGLLALAFTGASATAATPVERFTNQDTYYIYYGAWDSTRIDTVESNGYKIVVCEPRNLVRSQVEDIQDGADDISGNSDDIRVLGYISLGEDNRPSIYTTDGSGNTVFAPVSGGTGPRMDPRLNPTTGAAPSPMPSIESTINGDGSASLGLPSPGGTGYASFYLDQAPFDGYPDANGEFAGAFVNAGDPAWYTTVKNMVQSVDGNCGLDEIMTTTVGKGLGCDGIFMDTIDTCAPNNFSPLTQFEWTGPGYRQLIKTIREAYTDKILLQNRGTFFFRTDVEHYNFTVRPYVDMVFFESYYGDSNDFDTQSPYLNDNKWNVGKKMNAEADRDDGFTVLSLGYLEPRAVRDTITIDGTVTDWDAESRLQVNGTTPGTDPIQAVYASNDANYLYLRISTLAGTNLNSSNFNIYFDTDDEADYGDISTFDNTGVACGTAVQSGYVPTGATENADIWCPASGSVVTITDSRIRSELLYQWGGLYSQDTGVFNVNGSIGSATVAANGTQSEWEIRIPRSITHPSNHGRYPNESVFGADGSHVLMTMSFHDGSTTTWFPHEFHRGFEKNVGYRFEQASPGSVYDGDFEESQEIQGWLLYETDKFLSFAPNTRTTTWNSQNADTSAPVWGTTANGFIARGGSPTNSARTGIQEVVAGDGEVTVRWDLADDQTRPVRYKIYYAPDATAGSDMTVSPWVNTGLVSGTAPANYKYGSWTANNTNVYSNEYTVTGLDNGVTYRFCVRAVDSASTPHETTNTNTLTATPQVNGGSAWATITVDGSFSDWPAAAKIWEDPSGDNGTATSDVKAIWVANDADNIYMRVETHNSHDFPNQYNNIYFDTDLNGSDTAFNPHGIGAIFSELLLQGGSLYSQKNGNFNDGSLGTVGISPFAVNATSWEWSIPRNLQHPSGLGGGDVFSSTGFKVLVTSGSSSSDELAGAATYTFATPSTYATITADGTLGAGEWPASAKVYSDPASDTLGAATDFAAIWMANDTSNLYVRVDTHNSHNMPGAFNNFYFDTDLGNTPGFNPHGLSKISSKLLLNGVSLFSEGNGGYNDGYISGTTYGPTAGTSATSWEFAIPLNIVHPSGSGARANQNVFPALGSTIQALFTSDNSGAAEFAPDAGALSYILADLPITPQGTSATITVDGNGSDWPTGAQVWTDASGDNSGAASDVAAVWLADDADYIYLRVDTHNSHDFVSASNNIYFDANLSAASGFNPHSLLFGSEMLMVNTGLYSQKNGGWNEGGVTSSSGKTVSVSPGSGSATTWEWRIPRDLVHPSAGGNVFAQTDKSFFLLVTSDNSGAAELAPDNPSSEWIWYVPVN